MPATASFARTCASDAVYVALIVSFSMRKAATCSESWRSALLELRGLLLQRVNCCCRFATWRSIRDAALECCPGEILAALAQRFAGLAGEALVPRAHLLPLQLDPLLRGRDLGEGLTHLLQQLHLLVVTVVEGVTGVLDLVEGLRGLAAEDRAHPRGVVRSWSDPLSRAVGAGDGRLPESAQRSSRPVQSAQLLHARRAARRPRGRRRRRSVVSVSSVEPASPAATAERNRPHQGGRPGRRVARRGQRPRRGRRSRSRSP